MSITKIVITGGPSAGKTTGLSWIQNEFTKRGYKVLFVPETATELITGGVAPWTCGTNLDYQRCQMKLQMEKEDVGRHRSEGLKKTLRVEKSRIVFGLEQKTDRRIGHDKARTRVLTMLAQHGYITIKGSMTAYYSVYMRRAVHIEAYAVSIGVNIEQWETEEL